jgi:ABC-2 type transport system permease protein
LVPGQVGVFQRLRWRILWNTLIEAADTSALRLALIFVFSMVVWACIFGFSAEGFYYLKSKSIPLAGGIVGTLFDFLFLTLGTLLIFSTGIILYSSLFSAAETSFLLSTPATADHVFAYKFQGAIGFSSWAFILLGSPILIAYGMAYDVPWYYYLALPLFFLGFVLLPGAVGAIFCLLTINYLPRRPKQMLLFFGLMLVAGVGLWLHNIQDSFARDNIDLIDRNFVQRLVGQIAAAQGPLSPNHWLSQGLQAAARGDRGKMIYYLALVWSNALLLYVLVVWASTRLYRRGYNRLATGGSLRRRYGGQWLDRALSALVRFLDPQTRLLIVKDFRMFRRDPAQWAQVLIFVGLMVLYFANIRRFYRQDIGNYGNAISLMNLSATALLLCAYTGRFIFPMLSLEGRKFWILGLLPLERDRLLWGKFAFSATWSLLTAEFLVIFSDWMLTVPGHLITIHALTVAVLALGLSGLSVGLGACMPNFRESDPSKIAVGFGGTLNLIAGLLFLLLIIGLMATPWHLELIERFGEISGWWLAFGIIAGLALGGAAVALPLRIGARALRRMEF